MTSLLDVQLDTPPDRIDLAIEVVSAFGGRHLVPILKACRDRGCRNLIVPPGRSSFSIPDLSRPVISIVADDHDLSYGPGGFHKASIRRVVQMSSVALVAVGAADPWEYAHAAEAASVARQHVVIVETAFPHKPAWLRFICDARPGIRLIGSKVARGAH